MVIDTAFRTAERSAKDESPLVSVCMPLYNTSRYVAQAIEGVLGQTYRNLELIICDNGSTDGSLAIAQEFAQEDPRIRLIRNRRNLGYAGNLHKVTSLARGDFMLVHCADDLSRPNAVDRLVGLATQPGVSLERVMVLADSFVGGADGTPTGVHRQRPGGFDLAFEPLETYQPTGEIRRFRGRQALAYALPRLTIVGWLGATFYSRALFESIEGVYNGLLYTPDLQLVYHLLSQDPEVLWIQEPLFTWRVHEAGQIGQALAQAVPKHAWDGYTYTFHFSQEELTGLGVRREAIVETFVDDLCLRRALYEIRTGSLILALRHLFVGLATYPGNTLCNLKFYVALAGVLLGPIGRVLARVGFAAGIWRRGRATKAPVAS